MKWTLNFPISVHPLPLCSFPTAAVHLRSQSLLPLYPTHHPLPSSTICSSPTYHSICFISLGSPFLSPSPMAPSVFHPFLIWFHISPTSLYLHPSLSPLSPSSIYKIFYFVSYVFTLHLPASFSTLTPPLPNPAPSAHYTPLIWFHLPPFNLCLTQWLPPYQHRCCFTCFTCWVLPAVYYFSPVSSICSLLLCLHIALSYFPSSPSSCPCCCHWSKLFFHVFQHPYPQKWWAQHMASWPYTVKTSLCILYLSFVLMGGRSSLWQKLSSVMTQLSTWHCGELFRYTMFRKS